MAVILSGYCADLDHSSCEGIAFVGNEASSCGCGCHDDEEA